MADLLKEFFLFDRVGLDATSLSQHVVDEWHFQFSYRNVNVQWSR